MMEILQKLRNRKEIKMVEFYSASMEFKRKKILFQSKMIWKLKKIKNYQHVIAILNHNAEDRCFNVFSYHLAMIKWLCCVQGDVVTLVPHSKVCVQVVLILGM